MCERYMAFLSQFFLNSLKGPLGLTLVDGVDLVSSVFFCHKNKTKQNVTMSSRDIRV